MKYAEARKIREEKPDLEHQLRAAKVTAWMVDNGEAEKSEAEELYMALLDAISNSDEEFDMLAYSLLEEIREEKRGNK